MSRMGVSMPSPTPRKALIGDNLALTKPDSRVVSREPSPTGEAIKWRAGQDASQRANTSRVDGSSMRIGGRDYVGFANFPNQVYRRATKNGFEFTLMVLGRSGLGKSTFINTLFSAELNSPNQIRPTKPGSTVTIESKKVRLVENSTTLHLTLVDTPGFGDAVDNSKCHEPIIQYIESKYTEYFAEETKIERKERIPDRCVHLCLYFIPPTGHGLTALDIEIMKRMHDIVNIVPVLAKADTLTEEEMARFKAQVTKDIETNGIKVYKFPEPEDEDEKKILDPIRKRIPFAVVGSNTLKEEGGKKTRIRQYPWGTVEIDNLGHNDFLALRDMIIRTNLIDLIDLTHNVHYENFRCKQMRGNRLSMVGVSVDAARDPFTAMEEDRKKREKQFMDQQREMDRMFEEKVKERKARLADRERQLDAREAELRRHLEEKKAEMEALKSDVDSPNPSVKVSRTNSKVSLANENGTRVSPTSTTTEKGKVKKTLGLFARN